MMLNQLLWRCRSRWHTLRLHNVIRCSDGWFCAYCDEDWGQ